MSHMLETFFDRARKKYLTIWKLVFFLFLGAVMAANFYIHPHHAEFGLDAYPGFWAAFGLVLAMLMVFVMKKIIQPLLVRPEKESIDAE